MNSLAAILLLGVMAGLDNFQAACGLGMLPLSRRRKVALGVSFGVCESGSALLGLVAGHFLKAHFFPGKLAGAIMLLISGGAILFTSLSSRDLEGAVNDGWMIFGLPLTLSLDNLVAGAGLGASGFPPILAATLIGAVSSAMGFAGLFLGDRGRLFLPRHAGVLSGTWLVLIAVMSLR